MIQEEKFNQWCVLELFGHTRIAGLVTEASIGGGSFVRVDVPNREGELIQTRFYNPTAIYSLSPVGKEIAIAAQNINSVPVRAWEMPKQLSPAISVEPTASFEDDDEEPSASSYDEDEEEFETVGDVRW
jgi:hypothetical protein